MYVLADGHRSTSLRHYAPDSLLTRWNSTVSKDSEGEDVSSESEMSDFLQTLSEPQEEEMEEEDDDVQVIFSQIEPYQDEL